MISTLLYQHEASSGDSHSRVYLAIPTLLVGTLTESLEGIAQLKTVIYKFPHVSIDSFYERSVMESIEDAVSRCMDLPSMYQDSIQMFSSGISQGVENLLLKTIDAIGMMGLSVVQIKLIDDVKATELNAARMTQQNFGGGAPAENH